MAQQEGQRMQFVNDNLQIFIAAGGVLAGVIIAMILLGAFRKRTRGRRGKRLGISEFHDLDQARRLVLIRRDGTEHLLMIGGAQDVVIETGIGAPAHEAQGATPVSAEQYEAVAFQPAPRQPRQPVFGVQMPVTPGDREPPPLTTTVKEQ